MAFRGQHEHSLDAKDRLTIPARFRAALSEGVVLTAGLDPCVEVYPAGDYASHEQEALAQLNPLSRSDRMMRRRLVARSHDDSLDSAGRIHLPKHLIDHAGLEGPCAVVGIANQLEIWNAERCASTTWRSTPALRRWQRRWPADRPAPEGVPADGGHT